MKRIALIAGAAALIFSSCAKELSPAPEKSGSRSTLILEGQAAPESRISIGELTEGKYPILWTAGDKIGVYSLTQGAEMENIPAALHSDSDGQNSGVFIINDEFTPAQGVNDLLIYYPYSAEKKVVDVEAMTGVNILVPQLQKQAAPNDSRSLGKYAFAWAKASYDATNPDSKPSFTLKHANTYVKITVSSSEFASYKLKSVTLADKSAEPVQLSGALTVDLASGALTVANAQPSVCVSIDEPKALSEPQTIYMSTLPCDFTGKDAYIVVSMVNDHQSVTIPISVTGKKIEANALNIIEVSDVKMSDNKADWFDPVETRLLAGGWCYGESNTIVCQTGADAITVNAKAHGDFAGAVKPAKIVLNFTYQHDGTNKFNNLVINGTAAESTNALYYPANEAKYDGTSWALDENYNFTIKSMAVDGWGAPGSMGKLLLMDENNNIIWAFNVWNSKNEIKEIPLKNGIIMDKNLCACSYEETKNAGRGSAYWQWGRPFGFAWGASLVAKMTTQATDLAYSARYAHRFLKYQGAAYSLTVWYMGQGTVRNRADRRDDLWGNPNTSSDAVNPENGHKTIFDPCPKGWMVCSPKILEEIVAGAEFEDCGNDGFWLKYKYNTTDYVYFPFAGLKWGETAGNPNNNKNDVCAVWGNSPTTSYSNSADGAYLMFYRCKGVFADIALQSNSNGRSGGQSIRCMKDTENR